MILHFNLGQLLRTYTTAQVFGYVSVTLALKAVYCIYFKPTPIGFTIKTRGWPIHMLASWAMRPALGMRNI